ncbi:MAG: hypothetical protein ABII71_03425 [Candidatus Micrarchaeota archaeon]
MRIYPKRFDKSEVLVFLVAAVIFTAISSILEYATGPPSPK